MGFFGLSGAPRPFCGGHDATSARMFVFWHFGCGLTAARGWSEKRFQFSQRLPDVCKQRFARQAWLPCLSLGYRRSGARATLQGLAFWRLCGKVAKRQLRGCACVYF